MQSSKVLTSKTNVATFVKYGAMPQSPYREHGKEKKLKEETRETTIRARVNLTERKKIENRAKISGKTVSDFIRDSTLGCEIKQRPDKSVYPLIIKPLNDFIRTLKELERVAYHKNFVDERILNNEIKKWQEYRTMIRERLW